MARMVVFTHSWKSPYVIEKGVGEKVSGDFCFKEIWGVSLLASTPGRDAARKGFEEELGSN